MSVPSAVGRSASYATLLERRDQGLDIGMLHPLRSVSVQVSRTSAFATVRLGLADVGEAPRHEVAGDGARERGNRYGDLTAAALMAARSSGEIGDHCPDELRAGS